MPSGITLGIGGNKGQLKWLLVYPYYVKKYETKLALCHHVMVELLIYIELGSNFEIIGAS